MCIRDRFEASQESDFYTLMRAHQFAKKSSFAVETCRRYGIHAQTARQVEQTFEQLMQIAKQQGLTHPNPRKQAEPAGAPSPALSGTLSPSDGERDGVRGPLSMPS